MPTRYYGVPTNIGTAAIANAALLGVKLDIKTFVVGDGGGSYYEPTPDMTALRRETWRGNIAFCEIDENMSNVINVAAYIPSDVGGFTAREIGALDSKGQLIGVANVPDAQIVKFEDGVTDESMFILSFAVTNPEVFNWYADPTVIIASKADIEKHNKIATSHPDIRALLDSLNEKLETSAQSISKLLINRNLTIWQRGTTITNPVNTYIADRLKLDGNGTFRAKLGTDSKPIGGAILTGNIDCRYLMEHIDFEQLDGRELTFSYSVDGNIISNTFIANVGNCPFDGDGRRLAGFSPGAGVLDWFNLDIGDRAMPFAPRPIAEEMALCQRYLRSIPIFTRGYAIAGMALGANYPMYTGMRIAPTITLLSDLEFNNITSLLFYNQDYNIVWSGIAAATGGYQMNRVYRLDAEL